jgi:type IV secretion system protein VirB3
MNDVPLESAPVRLSLTRPNLFLGGDRELVMFSGLIAGTLVFYAWNLAAAAVGTLLWSFSLFALRLMAKHDPRLRDVYRRHRLYRAYYPPLATPWRDNSAGQGRQYRDPWRLV